MSDFDKEAEREKLRKQYEKDKEKREKSERMSELLLQGATMTDTHCSECGDPIFSHQGQKFCPTCQREVREQKPETAEQQPEPVTSESTDEASGKTNPSASGATEIEIDEAITRENASTTESEPKNDDEAPATRTASDRSEPTATDEHPQPQPQHQSQSQPQGQPATPSDLSAARGSLIRTVTRFARQAETADDLTTARKYLKATEDAASALDALEQTET